jgi:hypothetical protein
LVCSSRKLWLATRDTIGLKGIFPLSSYDMATINLGGCVTNRDCTEIPNMASTNLSLKIFSSSNMGSASDSTKHLTLADEEAAINIREHLKVFMHIKELKHAICTAS